MEDSRGLINVAEWGLIRSGKTAINLELSVVVLSEEYFYNIELLKVV